MAYSPIWGGFIEAFYFADCATGKEFDLCAGLQIYTQFIKP